MNPTETPRSFLLPAGNELLGMVFLADFVVLVCAGMVEDIDDSRGWLLCVVGFCGLMVVRAACKRFQRVGIDGTEVRVLNIASWFRWRSFDVAEVASVAYVTTEAGKAHCLIVERVPSAARSWPCLELGGGPRAGRNDADAPLFVAFMAAVWRVRPAIKVQRLPSEYRGALRAGLQPANGRVQ